MARLQNKKQAAVTTGASRTSGLPCAMVWRLIRGLPGDRLGCPRLRQCAFRALRRPQHREARTARFHRRLGYVRPREQTHAATRRAHRIPRPTSV